MQTNYIFAELFLRRKNKFVFHEDSIKKKIKKPIDSKNSAILDFRTSFFKLWNPFELFIQKQNEFAKIFAMFSELSLE